MSVPFGTNYTDDRGESLAEPISALDLVDDVEADWASTMAGEHLPTNVHHLDQRRRNGAAPTNGAHPPTEDDWRARIRLTPASAFKIKPVRWVWQERMPAGEITLVPGREGVGKSTFFAWLAAQVTNGNLPGMHHGQPRAVLYAASEDSWSYTIAPRLLAAGADLDLVFRIDVVAEDGVSGLILPRDCKYIPEIAEETKASLLCCDPIMSLVDERINNFKAQELRKALEPLRRAAEAAGIAVPALVHFNKGQGSDVNTLIAGSRAWVEVARAVIAIAQDKEADDYTCVVSQAKNNLGRADLPNLTYTIDSVTLETEEGEDAHVGRLRWMGESERSVEDILAGTSRAEQMGDNAKAVAAWVSSTAKARGSAVSTGDVVKQFAGSMKDALVRKTLTRLVKAGELRSPSRGLYMPADSTAAGVTSGDLAEFVTPAVAAKMADPLYPPVTPSHLSQQQVRGVNGGVTKDSGSCPKCHNREDVVTCDSCERGFLRARARTTSTPKEQAPCRGCFAPTELRDRYDQPRCDRCTPLLDEDTPPP